MSTPRSLEGAGITRISRGLHGGNINGFTVLIGSVDRGWHVSVEGEHVAVVWTLAEAERVATLTAAEYAARQG